mmetsp:Transcript_6824/g.12354  ORF Transcript_6824/g.12354 Transcript_6824/m.12354 type:complete len:272 (+) Transcript_6824:85-900(+)|eukprot:CAMPEP_0201646082 /NCGR_PEP_ID=MMETSP0493-20130528/33311_1 /ASSEMBLY_ACC=CAM_ASM_000838 /TAXON_ID=420259 /ORGANISM="Thalassiosira gravida, Strain GMp14c1" /LENGTH=271 /DNA_ID=CAMNT_0048121169 /DNA_START=69 /DNA_END=884 /DNA_ORIENTATION=-
MGKVKQQSSSTSRKNPLLPTTNTQNENNARSYGAACSRFLLLLLPILSCACIIASLYLLAYGLDVSISDETISECLAHTDTKTTVLALVYIGATSSCLVTAMRNVQINVYHRLEQSESPCTWWTNLIGAIANIVAYIGFLLLATFDCEGAGDTSTLIHFVGAFLFFVLTGVYGVLHMVLLCGQRQYPVYCKVIFAIVPCAMIGSSIVFGLDMEGRVEFEWYSVAFAAVMIGLVSMLFLVDNVDDELRNFFCCRGRGRGSSAGQKRSSTLEL